MSWHDRDRVLSLEASTLLDSGEWHRLGTDLSRDAASSSRATLSGTYADFSGGRIRCVGVWRVVIH